MSQPCSSGITTKTASNLWLIGRPIDEISGRKLPTNGQVLRRFYSIHSSFQFILKRNLTKLQFLGALFIVCSIVVAKLPDLVGGGSAVNALPMAALFLAVIASTNSGELVERY